MTDIPAKKVRVYNLAVEINVSSESVIEFLKKQGFDVKTNMTLLSEEMISRVVNHFRKDLEKAEKHQKKMAEIKLKQAEAVEKQNAEIKAKAADKIVAEQKTEKEYTHRHAENFEPRPVQDSPAPQLHEAEPQKPEAVFTSEITQELPVTVQEVKPVDSKEMENNDDSKTAQSEVPVIIAEIKEDGEAVQADSSKDEPELYRTRTQHEMSKAKGLTVLGKMDLNVKRAPSPQPPVQREENKTKQFQAPITVTTTTAEESAEEKAKKAKKKKKKTKAKKVASPIVVDNEETKKQKKVKKFEVDQREVKDTIRRTLLAMEDSAVMNRAQLRKKKRKEREEEEIRRQEIRNQESTKLVVTEFISLGELANMLSVSAEQVIAKSFELGLMVTINQRLNGESIQLIAMEFGFEVEFSKEYTSDAIEDRPDTIDSLRPRMPIVTIMGHVDHGKTSLLDYIRKTNVVAGESGGITQHIGAYKVQIDPNSEKFITFLDTPGHEAFTAMRARGAQVTDIVILVVASDDSVMPQTIEAINHAQAASVPIIVAINKVDKPAANADRIRQQLADRNVLIEEYGGRYQCVEISAKTGFNVQLLLEKVLIEAEMLELRANPNRSARGVVIESKIETGRGVNSTVLIQKGILRVGDPFIAGVYQGKVKAMFDERDKRVMFAGPSTPIAILGFDGTPQAGDLFIVMDSDKAAREISLKRQQLKREQDNKQVKHITLDEISRQISIGGVKDLPIVVKADVDGSVEALSDSLLRLSAKEVVVKVIHRGVGAISESDVLLAHASGAIIIGFHVRPNLNARKLAENLNVDIRIYHVIYDAINELKTALEGMLEPVISEEVTGTVEVREVFKVPKIGTVAGCYVLEGKIARNSKLRVIREGIVIQESDILALKRFKDDVREVDAGYECGISLSNFNDIKIGDLFESFKLIETKKKLS